MGCHALLQGIFLTQGSNLCLQRWKPEQGGHTPFLPIPCLLCRSVKEPRGLLSFVPLLQPRSDPFMAGNQKHLRKNLRTNSLRRPQSGPGGRGILFPRFPGVGRASLSCYGPLALEFPRGPSEGEGCAEMESQNGLLRPGVQDGRVGGGALGKAGGSWQR